MNVSSVSNAVMASKASEAKEVGPDTDGDSDDAGTKAVQTPVKAAAPQGMGQVVDKTA